MNYHFMTRHFVDPNFEKRHFVKSTVILLLGLTGCSSLSETFDSAPGQGVGTKPITVVNHMVEHKQLRGSALQDSSIQHNEILTDGISRSEVLTDGSLPIGVGSAKRSDEKTLRVWIAPYIDDQGHFHESSRIHTVIQPSRWNVHPTGVHQNS